MKSSWPTGLGILLHCQFNGVEILYCRKEGGTQARQTDKQAQTQAHTEIHPEAPTEREREKKEPKPSQTFLHINKANTELSPVLTKAVRRCSIAM